MYYDDHELVDTTWSIRMICVFDYVKYDHIYLHVSNVKVCVLLLILLGDHVRLWLCPYVCSLRVDAWLIISTWLYESMMVILMML